MFLFIRVKREKLLFFVLFGDVSHGRTRETTTELEAFFACRDRGLLLLLNGVEVSFQLVRVERSEVGFLLLLLHNLNLLEAGEGVDGKLLSKRTRDGVRRRRFFGVLKLSLLGGLLTKFFFLGNPRFRDRKVSVTRIL